MGKRARHMSRQAKGPSKGAVLQIRGTQHFESEVLAAEQPVIVDFWAPWCAPCRMQSPVIEAAAKSYVGRVKFAKVNTEASPALAQSFNISSIPALLVFDRGEVIDARIGLTPAAQLASLAQRAMDKHDGVGLFSRVKRFFGGKSNTKDEAASSTPA